MKPDSIREELSAPAPVPQPLGTIEPDALKRIIAEEAGPPPWEVKPGLSEGDARNFVEVPTDWVLRWLNPRLVDQLGWRDWKPVMASDPRVKVLVRSTVDVANNIRRGGARDGDILAYLPRHWYDAKVRRQRELNAAQTQSAVDKQAVLKEEFDRGRFGPNIRLEHAVHPTHTIMDGRSMTD